jgi:hypothetical protein
LFYTWLFQTLSGLSNLSGVAIAILFFLAWVVLWLPIAVPLAIALKWHPPKPITVAQKLPLLASLYLLAPLVLWGATAVDGSTFASYGLPWNASVLRSAGIGILLGAVGIAVMFAIQYSLGWLKRSPMIDDTTTEPAKPALLPTMASTLLLGLWVGLTEELIFRGFLINQLQRDYAPWIAAAIASLIFAILHLVWEGKENIPQLPGLWLMGMVLVLARWVDGGNLGLAWGLHSGWIWAIATLDTTQLLVSSGHGPQWLTGAEGKPLSGVIGLLFLTATGAILWGIWGI